MWFVHRVLFEMSTVWIYWARSRWFHTFQPCFRSVFFHWGMFGAGNYFAEDPVLWHSAMHCGCQPYCTLLVFIVSGWTWWKFQGRITRTSIDPSVMDFFMFEVLVITWVLSPLVSLCGCATNCSPHAAQKYEWNDHKTYGGFNTHAYECF